MKNAAEINKYSTQEKRDFWTNAILGAEKKTGHTIYVSDTRRTYNEQAALHAINPKNAKPGTSKHETDEAIDINVITPSGEWIKKKDSAEKWLKTGVPQYLKSLGLKWGGEFRTYHDPVHFEIPKNMFEKIYDTAKKNAKGLGAFLLIIAALLIFLIVKP